MRERQRDVEHYVLLEMIHEQLKTKQKRMKIVDQCKTLAKRENEGGNEGGTEGRGRKVEKEGQRRRPSEENDGRCSCSPCFLSADLHARKYLRSDG